MPSRLISTSRSDNTKAISRAAALENKIVIQAKGPWQGFTPDIDVDLLGPTAARTITGLIAKPDIGGQGEVLTADSGYARISSGSAALSDLTANWTTTPALANTGSNDIVSIIEMRRTTAGGVSSGTGYGLRQLAIVGGDGTANSQVLFWLSDASPPVWQVLDPSADTNSIEAGGGRDNIPDWAIMPSGAPARSTPSASFANVSEPCLIWVNGTDEVRIWPDADGVTTPDHEQLTDEAALNPFVSRSVENFRGRLVYLNNQEGGSTFPQRMRWTAPFTADPTSTLAGSGVLDWREFQRDGLRAETLGNVLACYFEDGVGIASLTGVATSPFSRTVLTQTRGLMSTHAVCPIDPNVHFGIFTDGWWLLDSSGRWTEVGVMDVGGSAQRKWRDTFYSRLDANNRTRLFCYYDQRCSRVYISVPVEDVAAPTEVWIWDVKTDRVWIDTYPVAPICFGSYTISIQQAIQWDNSSLGTWADPGSNALGTWAEAGSRFGLSGLVHGNGSGRVMRHDGNLFQKDGSATTYGYETVLGPLGAPRKFKTTNRVTLEAINKATPNPSVTVFCSSTPAAQTGSANLNRNSLNDIEVDSVYSRLTSENIGIRIAGTHPLMLRSFEAELIIDDSERRTG